MQSRPIPVHLEIANEQEFLAAVSKLASEAEQKLRLGVNLTMSAPGGGLPPRMEMPSPQHFMGASYPNQPMKTEQEVRVIRDQNISAMRTPQSDSVTQLSRDLNRYTSQLTTMADRGQFGMSVNPARQQMLEHKVAGLVAEMESQFNRFTAKNPLDQIAKQSNLINTQIQSELKLPPAQQDTTKVGALQQQLTNLQGLQNTAANMQEQINRGQSALRASQEIPASSYPTQGSLHSQFQTVHGRARTLFGTVLPMVAPVLGLKSIGSSYSSASGVADAAGAIAMQAGGNPNSVWNQLNTVGLAQGFSASQMSQAVQSQGQFAGTSNMAFLFRDAQETAQFARSLGISGNASAQILGAYQLSGAFSGGNEAGTANSIAAAAAASGTNSQMFLAGVQQLATAGMRGGTFTSGGPATSLSILNQLGSSMHIPLFKGSQGATTLGTWQQGLAAGPGGQGGLFSAEMLPIYQEMEKAMAPQYAKIGITQPWQIVASLTQTPIVDYPKQMLAPALTAVHKELMNTPANQRSFLEMGLAQNMFGGLSLNSLQSAYALGQPGFTKHLDATLQEIQKQKDALQKHATTYQHSIAGKVQQNQAGVQRIADTVGQWAINAGNAVIPALAAAPALTGGLGLGLDAAATFGGWLGTGALLRKIAGKGVGSAFPRSIEEAGKIVGGSSGGNFLTRMLAKFGIGGAAADAGAVAGDVAGAGIGRGIGGVLGGALGSLTDVFDGPLGTIAGVGLGSAAGAWIGHLFSGGGKTSPKSSMSQVETGAIQTFAAIAAVGASSSFQQFVKAFLQNGYLASGGTSGSHSISLGAPGNSLFASGIGSVGLGLNNTQVLTASGNPAIGSISTGSVSSAPGSVNQFTSLINKEASKFNVPANVIGGIMSQESGGNPYSLHDNTTGQSYTNLSKSQYLSLANRLIAQGNSVDMGLMQLNNRAHPNTSPLQAATPSYAIAKAAQILSTNYAAMHDSWSGAIRAYNVGVGGAQNGKGYTYLQDVENKMAAITTKSRPSAKHNLNRKKKVNQQTMLHQRVGPAVP